MNNLPDISDAFSGSESESGNLLKYVKALQPEVIAQLSRPTSKDVTQVMEHNIIGLLGGLPGDGFDVTITTNRENLGQLLASAMMSGYFLRNVEQRFNFEQSIEQQFDAE